MNVIAWKRILLSITAGFIFLFVYGVKKIDCHGETLKKAPYTSLFVFQRARGERLK